MIIQNGAEYLLVPNSNIVRLPFVSNLYVVVVRN
jgi:hypothetical protein